jgi:putative Mn2+ efflux pump MntP
VDLWTVLALAVALSMDALAVAVATGASLRRVSRRQTFRLAWHFGLFQALMPVAGWASGLALVRFIQAYDHWVAFGLLGFIGGRMVYAGLSGKDEEAETRDPTRGLNLMMLSFATSIDALAVGFSLSLLNVAIWWPALTIGVVTASVTAAGLHAGKVLGRVRRLGAMADLLGGVVLIVIGLGILLRHG